MRRNLNGAPGCPFIIGLNGVQGRFFLPCFIPVKEGIEKEVVEEEEVEKEERKVEEEKVIVEEAEEEVEEEEEEV